MNRDTVGGALAVTYEQYEAAEGYSNLFWGWGGEDNNMMQRLNKLGLQRRPVEVGRYKAMEHPRVKGLDETKQFKDNYAKMGKRDNGIATAKSVPYLIVAELLARAVMMEWGDLIFVSGEPGVRAGDR